MSHGLVRMILLVIAGFVLTNMTEIHAQTTSFNYQGRLQDGGNVANGSYDFQFTLWDAVSGGTQQPQPSPVTVTRSSVAVANGVFTVSLDFGANAFPGTNRWLETSVRLAGSSSFTLLSPRLPITPTPYAIRSASAASADNVPVSAIPPGNANYIQNSTAQQVNANFNISGNGSVAGTLSGNAVNSSTTLNISGNKVVSVTGDTIFPASNTFVGVNTGNSNTPNANGDGGQNSFYGFDSGFFNTTGKANSFFGASAGQGNTSGISNSFFGQQAGSGNMTGSNNSFFGMSAGFTSSTSHDNSFFGINAGRNQSGNFNTYLGGQAGQTTTGDANTFVGFNTGVQGQSSSNTLVGYSAGLGSANLSNATAIGAGAIVNKSNSLVLGATGTNVGIGTTSPSARLDVSGNANVNGNLTVSGTLNATLPTGSGNYIQNTTTQQASSNFNISGNGIVAGTLQAGSVSASGAGIVNNLFASAARLSSGLLIAPLSVLDVVSPTGQQILMGGGAATGSEIKLTNSGTAHFSIYNSGNSNLTFANTSSLINPNTAGTPLMSITASGNVGIGTASPSSKLHVNGVIRMDSLGSPVGIFPLCWNANDQIASCSSSSLRYKTAVHLFNGGLAIIKRLRPISFTWRDGGMRDIGLAAEEVEAVEPMLTYSNKKGEVEGVRYNQLSAVFINAFKEQQTQIAAQQEQLKREEAEIKNQQQQLNALKALVCRSHRRASVCK